MTTASVSARPRQWQRFSVPERIMRSAFHLLVIIAVVWSLPHGSSAAPGVATPYPSVSGDLGQHLAELQRSVAP